MFFINQALFFYDGECGFCNSTVLFLMGITSGEKLVFASLQSVFCQDFFKKNSFPKPDMTTAYLYYNGRLYKKSTAVLNALSLSHTSFRLLSKLQVIPRFIRDSVYDLIASIRFLIPVKGSQCRVLSSEERQRFIS
jgi:predicted DCC family thiol-disulfide oxidoreductase YuxK